MKEIALEVLKGLLSSKKFGALIVGLLTALAARLSLPDELAKETALVVVGIFAVFINAQGRADTGKEAALIAKEES